MLVNLSTLTPTMQDALRRLVAAIRDHDGISPINESGSLGIDGVREADFFFMGRRSDPFGFVLCDERDGTLQVGVHPDHRRRGISLALLGHCLHAMRASGCTEAGIGITEVALATFASHNYPEGMEPGIDADATFDPDNFSFPHGTHLCAMEVDTETGKATIRKYVAVDDVGVQVNPMIVEGQIHGGLVQGIAQGMGIDDVVVSPTFTILNYYENTIPLQHFDFYRLEEEYELDDLGFDDYLESGVTVIEWSEKFPDRLPDDAAVVTIEKTSPTDRLFHFDFHGSRWQAVENEVKKYALSH